MHKKLPKLYNQPVKTLSVNTIIIGAGQAGLSVSYGLTRKKVAHRILEAKQVADSWSSHRWNSFSLITPNYMTILPGFKYKGNNPNGFDKRDMVVKFLKDYAKSFNAPVLTNTKVTLLTKNKKGFLAKTKNRTYQAKNVVISIGSFHKPQIPKVSKSIPRNILQLHSSQYKNPSQLPNGPVLIVGGGNSGIQITQDLNKAKRKVYLSIGRLRIVPRVYRGKDFMEWAKLLGALDKTAEEATPEIKATIAPNLFGYKETIDLRKMAKNGIQLTGRLKDFKNGAFNFDNDLETNLEIGENTLTAFKNAVDQFAIKNKIRVSKEKNQKRSNFKPKPVSKLNSKEIGTIIWATGFVDDYSWLKIPVFDKNNEPIHKKGVSKIKGLYFIGLRWLSKYQSFLLCGVAEDAEYIAKQIN